MAWRQINPETIQNGFRKAGLLLGVDTAATSSESDDMDDEEDKDDVDDDPSLSEDSEYDSSFDGFTNDSYDNAATNDNS